MKKSIFHYTRLLLGAAFIICCFTFSTCKYGFRDAAPIPAEIKTFRVNYIENKAQYINTQLSPNITEKLKQKIIGITRLKQTNDDNADYDISGYVSQYYTQTISISGNNSNGNRLTVGVHLVFRNNKDDKKNFEADLTRTFDYSANKSLSEAETELTSEIVKTLVDEIFNRIFSNW